MEHYQEQAMILTFIRLLLRRNVIFSLHRMDGIRPPKVCIPLQVFRSKKKLNQHGHFFSENNSPSPDEEQEQEHQQQNV